MKKNDPRQISFWNKIIRNIPHGPRLAAVFFGVLSLVLAVWLGFALWLPGASGDAVLMSVQRLSVPGTLEFSILSAGIRNARLVCSTPDGSFRCDDIRVRYSPWRIHSGRVKEIVLKHARITPAALYTFDRWFSASLHGDPGFSARRIEFDRCTFVPGGDTAPIVFSGRLVPDPHAKWRFLHGCLKSCDDEGRSMNLIVEYRTMKRELDLSGTMSVRMGARPLQRMERILTFCRSGKEPSGNTMFDVSLNIRDISLNLEGTDTRSRISRAEADFSAVSGPVSLTDGYCSFDAVSGTLNGNASLADGKNAPVPISFSATGPWFESLSIETSPAETAGTVCWEFGPEERFVKPSFSLKGNFQDGMSLFNGNAAFACEKFQFGSVSAGSLKCASAVSADLLFRTWEIGDFAYNSKFCFCHAPAVVTTAAVSNGRSVRTFRMENGHLEFPFLRLQFGNMNIGEQFSAGTIRMNGIELGSVSGKCGIRDELKTFEISASAKLLDQNGSLTAVMYPETPERSSLQLNFPVQKISGNGRKILEFFVPMLDTGTLSGTADFQFICAPEKKTCSFRLTGGSFELPAAAVSVGGLSIQMSFPDYEDSRSATVPACPFSFEKLSIGGLNLGKGDGSFRIGSDGVLRIETASAEWCGGKISIGPVDFAPGRHGSVADCADIDFAQMLTQFGLGKFAGAGRVSGKIPFTLTPDGLRLQNGHLYSVPGADGSLKGELLETVMSGKDIADDRLSFACEMIRDMQYRWVKAGISSNRSGGITLALSFNGSPRRELFYEPDLEKGGIRKSSRPMKLGFLLLNLDEVNLQTDALNKTVNFFLKKQ